MGEMKVVAKPDGEKKPVVVDDGAAVTSIYKIELHCEGYAKKVRHAVRHLDGVKKVKTDCEGNKLTVIGMADPTKVKERLEQKIKKKVELISPIPKKESLVIVAGEKKPEEKRLRRNPRTKNPKTRKSKTKRLRRKNLETKSQRRKKPPRSLKMLRLF